MAKKAKEDAQRVLFARLHKIWTDISFGDWLGLLSEIAPLSRFTRNKGHLKGLCPFHEDSTASFYVTPDKGMVKCFGCHKMFFNPVQFIAALKNCSFGDAILFLRKRFGLKGTIPEALYEKVRDHEIYQRHKQAFMKLSSTTLLAAFTSYSNGTLAADGFLWAEPTIAYLRARRMGENAPGERTPGDDTSDATFDPYGVWTTICGRQVLGIFPPKALVINHFGETSEEYKFYCSYFGTYTEGHGQVGWIVLPLNDEPGSICRFKLKPPTSEKTLTPLMVSDAYEAEMGGFRGFFGLSYWQPYLSSDAGGGSDGASFTAHLFEGEFDALAAIAQQIRRGDDFIAISLGGGSAQPVDRLLNFGIKQAWIVGDRDKGGERFERRVMEGVKSKDLSMRIFRWPDEYADWRDPTRPEKRIKDPDDAIREMSYARFRRVVTDPAFYDQPHEWCYDQAVAQLTAANTTDIQQINRTAKEWGALLRDDQLCSLFCDAMARNYGLDAAVLKRDIRARDEDEQAYIGRMTDVLREKFHPIGIQHGESRKRILNLWNKETRTIDSVVLNDERSAETLIARYYGPIYEFVASTLTEPAFMIGDGVEESSMNISFKVKRYREYLTYALLKLAQGLPVMDHAPTKAQGIHMVDSTTDTLRGYMVNGRDVWRLDHDGSKFTARFLDGPSDEGVIFDNSGEAWCQTVHKVEDFDKPVDLVDLFLRVRGMIEAGWGFRHQQLDVTFLAAHVMCLAVMTVFTRQTAVTINAEAASGKSRFTSGFIGGAGFPRINVVAHAKSMQGYTAASVRQKHNNTSLCLCLEEFEDYGGNDQKSMTVRKVLELTRDLVSEGAVNWSIGTTNGEGRTFNLRFPLMVSAIHPLRDAASLSRFVQFELVKDDSRSDPVRAIVDKYGDDLIHQTRHDLVVGLIPRMLELRHHQNAVEQEYVSGGKMPAYAASRFREALYPAMAMLRMLGEIAASQGRAAAIPEYNTFACAFAESRKDQLARLKTTSANEQIFETVLSSTIQLSHGGGDNITNATSIRFMLGNINAHDDINKLKRGVYYDKKMEWLVVNWVEAQQGVLYQTKYRAETPTLLKTVSERSPHHISTEEIIAARTLERMVDVMGPCQPLALITAFSVKHIVAAARRRIHEATATAPSATTVDPPKATPAKDGEPAEDEADAAETEPAFDDIIV